MARKPKEYTDSNLEKDIKRGKILPNHAKDSSFIDSYKKNKEVRDSYKFDPEGTFRNNRSSLAQRIVGQSSLLSGLVSDNIPNSWDRNLKKNVGSINTIQPFKAINVLKTEVIIMASVLSRIQKSADANEKHLNEISDSLDRNNQDTKAIKNDVRSIYTKIDNQEQTLRTMDSTIERMKGDSRRIEGRLSRLEATVQTLKYGKNSSYVAGSQKASGTTDTNSGSLLDAAAGYGLMRGIGGALRGIGGTLARFAMNPLALGIAATGTAAYMAYEHVQGKRDRQEQGLPRNLESDEQLSKGLESGWGSRANRIGRTGNGSPGQGTTNQTTPIPTVPPIILDNKSNIADTIDDRIYRDRIDREKSQFMQFGAMPGGFEFIQGHRGRLGSPAAVAATGAMPLTGISGMGGSGGGYGGQYRSPGFRRGGYAGPQSEPYSSGGRQGGYGSPKASKESLEQYWGTPGNRGTVGESQSGSYGNYNDDVSVKDNMVDKQQFYNYSVKQFANSSLNGFVPKDGEKWGIDGSPESWAKFAMRVANAESSFKTDTVNSSDPGGSYGLYQFGNHYGINQDNWQDPKAQTQAFINYADKWVVQGGGYISPKGNQEAKKYNGYGGFDAAFSTTRNETIEQTRHHVIANELAANAPRKELGDRLPPLAIVSKEALAGEQLASGGKYDPNIIDKTEKAGFGDTFGKMDKVAGLTVHHTSGRGTSDGVISTFRERNYPAQYIMERDGTIVRAIPEGFRGQHMKPGQGEKGEGLSNKNMEGIEVIARDNSDWTQAQKDSMKKFGIWHSKKYGYDPLKTIVGHGEVNSHKEANEGLTYVDDLRKNYKQHVQDYDKLNSASKIVDAPVDMSKRGMTFGMKKPDSEKQRNISWSSLERPPTKEEIDNSMKNGIKYFDFDTSQPGGKEAADYVNSKKGEVITYNNGPGNPSWNEPYRPPAQVLEEAKAASGKYIHLDNFDKYSNSEKTRIIDDMKSIGKVVIPKNAPEFWAKYLEQNPDYAKNLPLGYIENMSKMGSEERAFATKLDKLIPGGLTNMEWPSETDPNKIKAVAQSTGIPTSLISGPERPDAAGNGGYHAPIGTPMLNAPAMPATPAMPEKLKTRLDMPKGANDNSAIGQQGLVSGIDLADSYDPGSSQQNKMPANAKVDATPVNPDIQQELNDLPTPVEAAPEPLPPPETPAPAQTQTAPQEATSEPSSGAVQRPPSQAPSATEGGAHGGSGRHNPETRGAEPGSGGRGSQGRCFL